MGYTKLLEPFTLQFEHNSKKYEAEVIYAKSNASCVNFFDVHVKTPQGIAPFYLKEKLIRSDTPEHMLWTDQNDKLTVIYQRIGWEIESHLRTKLGIFLLDASSHYLEDDQRDKEE